MYEVIEIESDVYHFVLFISAVSHNESVLMIDNRYNTIRTYTIHTLTAYRDNNYTDLQKDIVFAESVALSNGNFIFCYNTSLYSDNIYCELLGFDNETIHNMINYKLILECHSERDEYFSMLSLSETKVFMFIISTTEAAEIHIKIIKIKLTP